MTRGRGALWRGGREGGEEDFYEAGDAVVDDVCLAYPEIAGGEGRAVGGLPKPEVGVEDAMGEDVLDTMAQANCA